MKKYALIGKEISYSLSPKIHSIIYAYLGINATYSLLDGEFEDIVDSLNSLDGFNVTQPYKQEVKTILTKNNSKFEGVNTVVRDGKNFTGFNTDAYGFEKDFLPLVQNIKKETFHILGRGATARLVRQILLSYGAMECNNLPSILINASPRYLDKNEKYIPSICEKNLKIAYDTIYFETSFNKHYNCKCGLGMLVYQAIEACRIFFNVEIEDEQALFDKIIEELKK
ncbi:MAG: hypothetical protein FWC11_04885 [Firmicutes bacterium]|nr:hypothetical protein [Bacillota bacterium]MCL2256178.1 hypothetical protein [Bacillota bacterium]